MIQGGIVVTTLSASDMEKARKIAVKDAIEWRGKSEMSKRMIDSILDYLRKTGVVE
jgi:hypothetical protein